MSRPLSVAAMRAIMAQNTDEAFIILIEFRHALSGQTFRVCMNTENITSGGQVYTATYFDFAPPETSDRAPQGCQVIVDNVDRALIALLRSITTPLDVTVRVVMASTPDVIELEFADLVLREVNWNAQQITGTLMSEDPLNQVFTGHVYDQRGFPGIF